MAQFGTVASESDSILELIGKSEAEVCHIRLARREKRKLQQEAADADRENEGT